MEQVKKKKRLSPFSKEFWMAKGYSESDADFKRNSIRPIRKEYWIVRGHSEEAAIKLALEKKDKNNRKGARGSAARPKEAMKLASPRCVEHWLAKGYSLKEAENKVKETQATFTLDKCISKHGLEEGTRIWQERQDNWQKSIQRLSPEATKKMNFEKNPLRLMKGETVDEMIIRIKQHRWDLVITKNPNEFIDLWLKPLFDKHPCLVFMPVDLFIQKKIPNYQMMIFKECEINIAEYVKSFFVSVDRFKVKKSRKNFKRGWSAWTEDGFLRSSLEIYFYDKFKQMFPNEQVVIEKNYDNSSFRSDFFVFNEHVEICPDYKKDKVYREKMKKKKKLFNCLLLQNISEVNIFLESKQKELCK
jgi:hypothetical protein